MKKLIYEYDPEEAVRSLEFLEPNIIKDSSYSEDQLGLMKLLAYKALKMKKVFSPMQRKRLGWIMMVMLKYEVSTLTKPPPKSWSIWCPIWPMTWELPCRLADKKRKVRSATLKTLRDNIVSVLQTVFSEDGKYKLSYFLYPHWQGISDKHPNVHIHGLIGVDRFHSDIMKISRKISVLKKWLAVSEQDKKAHVHELLQSPPVLMDDKHKNKINHLYRMQLIEMFGRKNVGGSTGLFWTTQKPVYVKDEHEKYARYMKNNPLNILKKIQLQYFEDKEVVKVRHQKFPWSHERCFIPGYVASYPLGEFMKRYVLTPLEPFGGAKFMPNGAFHGGSGLNKVLMFLIDHPECQPDYHRYNDGVDESFAIGEVD